LDQQFKPAELHKGRPTQSGLPSKFVGSKSCSSLKRPKKHTRGVSVSACANLQRKQVMDIIDLEAHSPTNRNKGIGTASGSYVHEPGG